MQFSKAVSKARGWAAVVVGGLEESVAGLEEMTKTRCCQHGVGLWHEVGFCRSCAGLTYSGLLSISWQGAGALTTCQSAAVSTSLTLAVMVTAASMRQRHQRQDSVTSAVNLLECVSVDSVRSAHHPICKHTS